MWDAWIKSRVQCVSLGAGSGMFIDNRRYILTSGHVFEQIHFPLTFDRPWQHMELQRGMTIATGSVALLFLIVYLWGVLHR